MVYNYIGEDFGILGFVLSKFVDKKILANRILKKTGLRLGRL